MTFSHRFFRKFLSASLLLLGLVMVPAAFAAPPAAPTGVTLDFTRAADSDASGNQTSFRIKWVDNATSEEGYRIDGRIGNSGAFTILQTLSANSQIAIITLATPAKDTVLQFRVTTYHQNGGNIEYAYSPTVSYTATEGAGSMNAPTELTAEKVGDGVVKLKWKDNSTNEFYHQILFKEADDENFSHVGYVHFNTVETSLQLGLIPGRTYQFVVRATRQAPTNGVISEASHVSAASNTVSVEVPSLTAPTELTGSVIGEATVQLNWKDNSTNETAYRIERKKTGETSFVSLGTVAANSKSVTVPTTPLEVALWRVVAVYSAEDVALESQASNEVQLSTAFHAPSELVAVTSAKAGAVELTWKDNSGVELGYEIMSRPPWQDFRTVTVVPAGTTTAIVSTRQDEAGTGNEALELDITHDFVVRAVYGTTKSVISNVASAPAKEGFTSRFYHPATKGVAFDTSSTRYVLTVSSPQTLLEWQIGGLAAAGLSFDSPTGVISGTPTASGVFTFPMTATFTGGHVASTNLTMRIREPQAAPVATSFADMIIGTNQVFTVPLAAKMTDAESETAVRMETTVGTLDILLYPSLAPQAVENFLGYVNSGSYDGVVFHRSLQNFIIQGGGYVPVAAPRTFRSVTPRPSPKNEPGISNVTGTIASAKVGGNPHSATHDFFFNLNNNNNPSNPESLDNQNGGFTAFGRVASPGLSLLNDMASLPVADYKDFNDYSGEAEYDSALDRRVIVDGSLASFESWPMDVLGNAPANMDVNLTLRVNRARQIEPLTFSVQNSAPAVVSATVAGSNLQIKGLKAGVSVLTVQVTDLDGAFATQTFQVEVKPSYRAPAITRHPTPVAVEAGGKATFSVAATGTSLVYQWRKAGADIPGATNAKLVIEEVSAADISTYDVVVSNGSGMVVSQAARLDFIAAPAITQQPASVAVKVGEELVLEAKASGAPAPVFAWTRDGRKVASQKTGQMKIPAAKFSDAGVYRTTASNPAGTQTTSEASVWVVDGTDTVITRKPGAKVVFATAGVGPGLTFQWMKDGSPLDDSDPRVKGWDTAVLTIDNTDVSDSAIYACEVTLPNADVVTSGEQKFAVVQRLTMEEFTCDPAVIGLDYDFTVPWDDSDPANTATEFIIQALPPGLKADRKTGRITGRPTAPGTYRVSVIARNAWGNSNAAAGILEVQALPTPAVGSFVAAIGASAVNDNLGGRLDLTVRHSGSYTGKITLGASTYPFAGALNYSPGEVSPQSEIVVQRPGKTPVTLVLVINDGTGALGGQVSDGVADSVLAGFRQFWNADFNRCVYADSYNMGIRLASADVGKAAIPQGSGYANILCFDRGTATITGKLPDGEGFLVNTMVGPGGQLVMFQPLYKKRGSLLATPNFGRANLGTSEKRLIRVDGSMRWTKGEQTETSARTYKAGFGPLTLTLAGCTYHPLEGAQIMNLPVQDDNVELDFSEGGLEAWSINPDVLMKIDSKNFAVVPRAGSTANPAKVKISNYGRNGMFTGTMQMVGPGNVKHSLWFHGMHVPKIPTTPAVAETSTTAALAEVPGADPVAEGFFLLPQPPSAGPPPTTLRTSPILAGKVAMRPIGISITSQPGSHEVDPGSPVHLTVAASGQGTLTYQWRKNLVPISGATAAIYSLTSAAEADEGSYDVVVTNGATTAFSAKATVVVRDPISNVVVTRSPSGAAVPTGGTVVFTVTANGSDPTYQWCRDGAEIVGATGATYMIDGLSASEHNGNYSVKVSNTITPDGVTSGYVNLVVLDGVTNVAISVTPNSTDVQAGESVTFHVTADGEAPLTYQWRKNELNISGATESSYTIPSASSADSGSYDVVVKNVASPDGVTGAAVTLNVVNGVLVTASRTPSNEVVVAGQVVTFSVTTPDSTEPWSYQWRRNGIDIPGANDSIYVVSVTDTDDDSGWDVVISSDSNPGFTSNTVPLRVQVPVFNVSVHVVPVGPVQVASTVTFSVVAEGSGPFSYQWRRDGQDISGATNSTYIIAGVNESDADSYDVVVSNDVSSVPSDPVQLEVVP